MSKPARKQRYPAPITKDGDPSGPMAGSLVGGIIGDVWGVHEALYVGIFFMAVAGLWVWRSPVPGMREIPEDVV